jgi:dienelactone hydrolase
MKAWHWVWGRVLAAAVLGTAPAHAERVVVPSLDAPSGTAVALPGHWFKAAASDIAKPAAPAMLALHGCGGLYDGRGRLATRYTDLAARLNAMGVHVLFTDSLQPRGEKELCTQRNSQRRVTQTQRRRDALGALEWLAAQPGVDASKLGLLGWSNGGSNVLSASNQRHPEVTAARVKPSLLVAFYPGCEAELARGYAPTAPLLMLLGEADDWTPAAPCKALAGAANDAAPPAGAKVQFEAYAGAFHGFDGTAPLRLRADVPGGVKPGHGVHVGADPAARAAAAARLENFIRDVWALTR